MDAAGDHGPILVVDDDAALAEMLQLVLIKEGFSTAWVGHGSDVMDVFREHRPALVLLDLMLPGRDGIRICQDIRRESGVPIIMLTARTDTPNVVQGLGAGADATNSDDHLGVVRVALHLGTQSLHMDVDQPRRWRSLDGQGGGR